jgi:hypothetical protein
MPAAAVRATTFQIRYQDALLTERQWDAEIRRAVAAANGVFRAHGISFALSQTTHLSEEASMALLTRSVEEESRAEGISRDAYFQRERRLDSYVQQSRTGARGPFRYGGFLVRAFPMSAAATSATAPRPASQEVLDILQLNRAAGEIATYWVPGFNSGYHGLTCMPEFNPGVSRAREGILISFGAARDILAHEIGHLLMRAGHCTFEGADGATEGSAPATNLMHRDNEFRTGTALTAGQVRRMLAEGRDYLRG